jgi:hypothetical protein
VRDREGTLQHRESPPRPVFEQARPMRIMFVIDRTFKAVRRWRRRPAGECVRCNRFNPSAQGGRLRRPADDAEFTAGRIRARRWSTHLGRAHLSRNRWLSPEIDMPKRVLTVLGVLLVAASTIQTASAARHGRKPAHAVVTQQSRDARASMPAAGETRSCDRFWCYPD